jgi:sporulation protein YtfJ
MVDVNTVVGNPVTASDGTIIIPVSKVSYGFASGGSSFAAKSAPNKDLFGGGAGAGVSINPLAFIVISHGNAKVLTIDEPNSTTAEKALAMAPEVVDKIIGLFKKENNKSKETETEPENTTTEE